MLVGRHARCLLALAALIVACDDLPAAQVGVCGNRVVDPDEDCDTFAVGDGTLCRAAGTVGQCRYACDRQPNGTTPVCPAGMGCGSDGTCRAPNGSFGPGNQTVAGTFAAILVGDVDDDHHADVVAIDHSHVTVDYFDDALVLASTFQTPRGQISLAHPLLRDLTGDGSADLVAAVTGGTLVDLGSADRTLVPTACPSAATPDFSNVRVIPLEALPGEPGDQIIAMGTFDGISAIAVLQSTGHDEILQVLPQPPSALAGDVAIGRLDEDAALSPCDQYAFAFRGAGEVDVYTSCKPDGMGGFVFNAGGMPTPIALAKGATVVRGPLLLDVNGDGHLDFVIGASACSGKGCEEVLVAYGVGDGTFHSDPLAIPKSAGDDRFSVYPPLAHSALPLAMGDLDGDGIPDVVTTSGAYVSKSGAGGEPLFHLAAVPSSGTWTEALIADLNHDGIPDVLAGSSATTGIDFFSGVGDGSLAPFQIPTSGPVGHFTLGDFDGDLVNDVALSEDAAKGDPLGDSVSVLFGNPVGAPSAPVSMGRFVGIQQMARARFPVNEPSAPFTYGVDDFLTVSVPNADETYLADFVGRGDRVLRSPFFMAAAIGNDLAGARPTRYALGSFIEAGGTIDVAAIGQQYVPTTTSPDYWLWLIPTDGHGQFVTEDNAWSPLPSGLDWSLAAIAAVDLDGSGVDRIVALGPSTSPSDPSGGAIAFVRAVPTGAMPGLPSRKFQVGTPSPIAARVSHAETDTPTAQTGRVVVADIDGDGRPDVVALASIAEPDAPPGAPTSPHVVVLWNDHKGTLDAMTVVPNPSDDGAPHAVVDFALLVPPGAAAGSASGIALLTDEGVSITHFSGRAPEAPAAPVVPVVGGHLVASGDVDGDGVPDLVVADDAGFSVYHGDAVRP